jgi:hypothetical protein
MFLRTHTTLALTLCVIGFAGDTAAADSTPLCTAPNVATHFYVSTPNCEQMWAYHIYRQMGTRWFGAWADATYAQLNNSMSEAQLRNTAVTIAFAIEGVFTSPSDQEILHVAPAGITPAQLNFVKSNLQLPRLLMGTGLVPDTVGGAIIAKELADYLLTAVEVGVTGGSDAIVIKKLWKLLLNEWALMEVTKLKNRMNSLLVASRYLQEYYKFGGNESLLGQKYGLPGNASIQQRLEALAAAQFGFRQFLNNPLLSDYDLVGTWKFIQTFQKEAVAPLVALCSKPSAPCLSRTKSDLLPALPFVERDNQIDVFKGRWRLRKDHPVYRREGDMKSTKAHLKAGSVVNALSIATRTLSYSVCEVKARRQEDFWDFETAGKADYSLTVEQGDRIAIVSYFGEGECRIWFKGRTYISMCPGNGGPIDQDECAGDLKQEYWAEILMKDGTRQWLHSPDAEGMSKHDSTVE